MSTLADIRTDIAARLAPHTGGAAVIPYPAAKVTAPAVVIGYGDPWIERVTVGPGLVAKVNLRLICIGGIAGLDNEGAVVATEQLVTKVLLGLDTGSIDHVLPPEPIKVGNSEMLASVIRFKVTVALT
jgi:hypothetical protein